MNVKATISLNTLLNMIKIYEKLPIRVTKLMFKQNITGQTNVNKKIKSIPGNFASFMFHPKVFSNIKQYLGKLQITPLFS